ncbi:dihydrofolate reductase family protein [Thalassobius sp. MITS945101]|uniref:dihydrofolate reductase family protein n=1 Tax=Thalassobius sp. MITS945101 TaxID=3096994 RepID=UPI00399A4A29
MVTGHVFIATSLDGFVARDDHTLDWLMKQPQPADDDGGYAAHMAEMDGLVMGAGSFRTVLGFGQWPYEKPVVVMSRSLAEADIPEDLRDKVRLSRLSPRDLMQDLFAQGWKRAYVDGGQLVQSFLRDGLIAEMKITLIPILLGSGIRLFGPLEADIDLELIGSRPIGDAMQQMHYGVT